MSKPKIRFKGYEEDWEQRKLGDVTELKSASRVHKGEWTDSGVPFFRSSDVMAAINGTTNEKAYISEELYEKLSNASGKLEEGDVLVTGGGSVGNPYIVPNNEPLYTKDADLLWIKNQGRFYPYFLYEYFFSPTFRIYLSSISHVGTIAHYTITQLSETPISLPDIEEQIKVGEYFESLDRLITLHQRKCEETKKLKKYMLQKMFPQNGKRVPEIRFAGFTDDWEQRKLENIVEVCSGRDYKHLEAGNIPVYGTGGYMLSVSEALSYDVDAIGIGRKGTIDKPYILKAPFWTVDTLFYCICKEGHNLNFVYDIFQNINWKAMDESTGVPSLSKTTINKVKTLIPSYLEQEKIGKYFSCLDKLITLHQRKYEELQKIKKFMLQNMFI
ncbi:restriction endonuclease subunit S [Anaerostipes hadrus]|uniref:restriction endonuclease subunit S n=1 Tax=Anaerostipes hadrus TaxID=649756 RepID=UPI001D01E0FE|nr:restriction endonuclease subunit S [Anaerostipes hadrus]MCB5441983.1 restriction endonuclease subunit S [Anaerostipes hadrus]